MGKLKLLILTQKVDINDDVLGFFHGWIAEFARHCELITVICLYKGEYNLPDNVKVLSLGKETGESKIKYLINFYKYIWQERNNYNAVFVHMNQVYVVLGGVFWRLTGKKINLWYNHRKTSWTLKLSARLSNKIFTSTRESFTVKSKKINAVGHAIDIEKFNKNINLKSGGIFKIVYVGRISRIKNQRLLIEAADILVNQNKLNNIKIDFIGGAIYPDDEVYLEQLQEIVNQKKLTQYVNFSGSLPFKEIEKIYSQADLSINLCPTGGMDKTVLESMASSLPVLVLNKSFIGLLKAKENILLLKYDDRNELAEKIEFLKNMDVGQYRRIGEELREKIAVNFNQKKVIETIINKITD